MGLLYSWATKEYLLWQCSLGQIVALYNEGCRLKYPTPEKEGESVLARLPKEELKKIREECKAMMSQKYGNIDDEVKG